jgi:hypothetical protein
VSAIASFHVFPETMLPELVQAAAVPPRISPTFTERVTALFSRRRQTHPQDPYWELLRARAEEQRECRWSGWAFAQLELVLPEGMSVLGGGRADPDATRLGELRESSALFDHDGARRLVELLRGVSLQPETVLAKISEELGGDLDAAKAVVEALATARQWLAAVRPGTLGLLSLG